MDGYQVLVLAGRNPEDAAVALAAEAEHLEDGPPPVLLGVDTGAVGVLLAARTAIRAAGLVLAGMPGDAQRIGADEAHVRLRDPGLRAALPDDYHVRPGELLTDPLPVEQLDGLFDDAVTVPTLVLHGDSDRLCPFATASRRALRLRRSRVVSVNGTAHDVFRDTQRASAIAEVLLFAERLRSGPFAPPPLRPLLRSTW
jgi:pimeloyl-ACP methyl ester carboxylesterase